MCGRFALARAPEALQADFDLVATPSHPPRYNIAPATPILAIRAPGGQRRADLLHWGLIPHWAKQSKLGYATINARAETAATAPSFRVPLRRRRCLIPADGFYEWQTRPGSKVKQPYYIARADGAPLAMAGLWDQWRDPQGTTVIESCSILVTAADPRLAPIHPRMPVLLDPDAFAAWLDPAPREPHQLQPLLRPYPGERLRICPVSRRVGNPRQDDPGLIEPIALPDVP